MSEKMYTLKWENKAGDLPEVPLSAGESHVLTLLHGLYAQVVKMGDAMEERLHTIPNGWRDYRMINSVLGNLMDKVWVTMPESAQRTVRAYMDHGEVVVRPKPFKSDYISIVENTDIKKMVNWIMEEKCVLCVRNPQEQRGCQIRKTLNKITPPEQFDKKHKNCEYKETVVSCALGDYIRGGERND